MFSLFALLCPMSGLSAEVEPTPSFDQLLEQRNDELIRALNENPSIDAEIVIACFNKDNKNLLENLEKSHALEADLAIPTNRMSSLNTTEKTDFIERTVELDNGNNLTFLKSGKFWVDELYEKQHAKTSSHVSRKTAGNQGTAYHWSGKFAIWRIYVEADFAYDGKSAWVEGNAHANYRRLVLFNPWKVEQWNVGWESAQGTLLARAYLRGMFSFGMGIMGVDLTIQEQSFDLRVTCNMNGHSFRSKGDWA